MQILCWLKFLEFKIALLSVTVIFSLYQVLNMRKMKVAMHVFILHGCIQQGMVSTETGKIARYIEMNFGEK